MNFLLSIATSALLWASFPPVNWWPLAWVALVPLLLALDRAMSWRAAFSIAYVSGFAFFLAVLFWIHYVTFFGLVLLSVYLAIYFGVFGGVYYYLRSRASPAFFCVLLSAGWVILEYARSVLFTGFGWGSLWSTQASFSGLIPLASVTGAAGLSFLVIAGNFIIKEIIFGKYPQIRIIIGPLLVGIIAAVLGSGSILPVIASTESIRVAVIQPNVSLSEAWDHRQKEDVVHRQLELSRRALVKSPKLIIWPETVFPNFIEDNPLLLEEIKVFARENSVYLLFGAVTRKEEKYYNSALLISPLGDIVAVRSKRHLVVFGEYIPFRKEFPLLQDIVPIDDFTPGEEDALFDVPGLGKFGVLICFEDTVPEVARRYVRHGARFLVNMTNDAWFRDSGQPRMHLNNALFRSVENRRPLVRATNTGESCSVDAAGNETDCVKDNTNRRVMIDGFMVTSLYPEGGMTIYTQWGEAFVTLCALIMLIGLLVTMRRKPQKIAGKKILLIDDERTLHTMLKTILAANGFMMISAMDGEEGLRMASVEKPDLILLDVIMPTMKGREVCQRLKASAGTRDIPVIFFTSKSSPDDIAAEIKAGSAGHITKPVNSATLINLVKKTLAL